MVTRDRPDLARRAIGCFTSQTWANKELVIIDDGALSYQAVVADLDDEAAVRYHRLRSVRGRLLGALRNEALDRAAGAYCTQWDDDEWYHPRRIERQMRPILERQRHASVLTFTLMHCDTEALGAHPFRTRLRFGTPGSLLHRRTEQRYPNLARGEDSAFLRAIWRTQQLARLGPDESHLLIRCFHGANTWEASHFTERLRFGPRARLHWLKAKYVDRDVRAHPAFALAPRERASVRAFLAESRRLGLLRH
jgi:glycosyltransferase involved in cell wall biosynthesis